MDILKLPLGRLKPLTRGGRWLDAAFRGQYLIKANPKALEILGKLPPHLRWTAMHGHEDGSVLRPSNMNWTMVRNVRDGKVKIKEVMPEKAFTSRSRYRSGWVKFPVFYKNTGTDICPALNWGISVRMMEDTLAALKIDQPSTEELAIPIMNLIRLFGKNSVALKQWITRFHTDEMDNETAVHDAGQIVLPSTKISPRWGELMVSHPSLKNYSMLFSDIEKAISTKELKWEAVKSVIDKLDLSKQSMLEKHVPNPRMAQEYIDLMSLEKGYCEVPLPKPVTVGQYQLQGLDSSDIRAPLAGLLTNCCQHLHGAAASCARATITSPKVAVWAIFKGEKMVAQSLVWRSGDWLVLDSIESLGDLPKEVVDMYVTACQSVLGVLGIEGVAVGNTSYGITRKIKTLDTSFSPEKISDMTYYDCGWNCPVVAVGHKMTTEVEAVYETLTSDVQAVNELLEGSDVYCEYCDAEVHPAAEICPSCAQDISVWVD